MFYRRKKKRQKYKPRPVRVFTQQEVKGFYLYCSVLLNDQEKVLTIMRESFERWKIIPREFLKRPEIYFYQLLRKRCYLSLGENHKSTEVNESNVFDISINGIDMIDVGQFEEFVDEFWKLKPMSRELLFFWAMEHRSVDEISKLIGRKRVEILAQLIDIRAKFTAGENDAD